MKDVYEECPVLENDFFKLRLISQEDAEDLFKVYGDKKCVPYFNPDNCHGTDFYCSKLEYVKESIKYWLIEYNGRGFVRWSIIDQQTKEAIGTIELFHRDSNDFYNNCGLLRLDVRADYEKKEKLKEILSLIIESAYDLFECDMIATKGMSYAKERRCALGELNFSEMQEKLVGNDGTEYDCYWTRMKN